MLQEKLTITDYVLSAEEEIFKAIANVNLEQAMQDYIVSTSYGLRNKLLKIFSRKHRKSIKIRNQQLLFLQQVKYKLISYPAENQAFIFLGAFQYIQGRYGVFDAEGALYQVRLKTDELQQIIGEYASCIDMAALFNNPELINQQADKHFAEFVQQHQSLIKAN